MIDWCGDGSLIIPLAAALSCSVLSCCCALGLAVNTVRFAPTRVRVQHDTFIRSSRAAIWALLQVSTTPHSLAHDCTLNPSLSLPAIVNKLVQMAFNKLVHMSLVTPARSIKQEDT